MNVLVRVDSVVARCEVDQSGFVIDLDVADVLNEYVKDPAITPGLRDEVIRWKMRNASFGLTQKRAAEEAKDGRTQGGKLPPCLRCMVHPWAQDRQDLIVDLMGVQGVGWEGDAFSEDEIGAARSWLASRAVTIYGGTNEVQANIIAKPRPRPPRLNPAHTLGRR